MRFGGTLIAAISMAGWVAAAPAAAFEQGAPLPGEDRPLPTIAPSPELDFSIQAPRRSPVPRAVEELTFDVREVKITGATLYDQASLRSLTAPVTGQTVHLADLIAIAEQIEARYHADGYVLTRVFVPTQNVSDGVFQISVIEGYIAAVAVQGGEEDSRERVRALLDPLTQARPLRLSLLETALLTANQLPGVSVSGLLRPSPTEPGASELVVTVADAPMAGSLSADNSGGANTGRWTLSAESSIHSPLGDGGQVTLDASVDPADGQRRHSISGRYVAPLPLLDGLTYSLSGLYSFGQPGGTVAALSLVTNSTALAGRLSLPLIASRAEKLSLDAGFTVEGSDVHSGSSAVSHDEWRVVDLALAYQNTAWAEGSSNASLDLSQGIPGLGASPSGSPTLSQPGGSTDFTKLSGQVRRVQSLIGDISASLLISGQYSPNPLITGEKVSYGGTQIGHGYDPGSITGDEGVGSSAELRYDLDAPSLSLDQAQLYGFFDAAKVWTHTGGLTNNHLSSTGAGIRTAAFGAMSLSVEFGTALIAVPGNDKDKRSQRVTVNTSVRF